MNAKKLLEAESKNNRESHAYLFIGDTGDAEELVEYIVKARNILPIDISTVRPEEKDGKAGEIKVEDTRRLLHEISRSPKGKFRLAVIYNCERMNASSGNVLLKSIEEPAGPVIFALIASSPAVLSTIKSRCRIIHLGSVDKGIEDGEYISRLKNGFAEASPLIDKAVKEGDTERILLELENNQRQKMLDQKDKKFVQNLEEIAKAKRKIGQNGNPRLILECLILKIGNNL